VLRASRTNRFKGRIGLGFTSEQCPFGVPVLNAGIVMLCVTKCLRANYHKVIMTIWFEDFVAKTLSNLIFAQYHEQIQYDSICTKNPQKWREGYGRRHSMPKVCRRNG